MPDFKARPWISPMPYPTPSTQLCLRLRKPVDLLQPSLFASSHLDSLLCRRLIERSFQHSHRQLHPRHPMLFVQPRLPPSFSLYHTRPLLLKLCFQYPWQPQSQTVHLSLRLLHRRQQSVACPSSSGWFHLQSCRHCLYDRTRCHWNSLQSAVSNIVVSDSGHFYRQK